MMDLDSLLEDLHEEDLQRKPEVVSRHKSGWGMFTDEVAWFLYDFFKFRLNGYEKLLFYSYYINGLTMEELSQSCSKTIQAVNIDIININRKLSYTWKNRKNWKVDPNECSNKDQSDRRRNKSRSK